MCPVSHCSLKELLYGSVCKQREGLKCKWVRECCIYVLNGGKWCFWRGKDWLLNFTCSLICTWSLSYDVGVISIAQCDMAAWLREGWNSYMLRCILSLIATLHPQHTSVTAAMMLSQLPLTFAALLLCTGVIVSYVPIFESFMQITQVSSHFRPSQEDCPV